MVTELDLKIKSFPDEKKLLVTQIFFWDTETEKIMAGHKSEDMDDKWFIYFQEICIFFIRRWAGHYIFAFQVAGTPAGVVKVIESGVNKDTVQYRSP